MARVRRVRRRERRRGGRHPDDVPAGAVVLRGGRVRAGARAGLLQLLRRRAHGHQHGLQLRPARALRPRGVGRARRRRRGRPRRLRAGQAAGAHLRRPHARLQDGAPDPDVAALHARRAGRRRRHRLRRHAAHLPPLLQGVRRRQPQRVLEGAVRAHLPQHGATGRPGLLGAAHALPAAVRGVLRVRRARQRRQGRPAAAVQEVRAAADGDGRAVPRRR